LALGISISDRDLKTITDFVHKKRGLNLSHFRPVFISKRISVRMKMLDMTNSLQYVQHLNSDLDEVGTLYDSLSINVTKFYRDKKVWQLFGNKIIPDLLKDSKISGKLRIWSCGCATGEEPYSLAIMFSEALDNPQNKIKIQATDINSYSLQYARKGIYTKDNVKNLDSLLLTKYFKKIDSTRYQVIDELKDLISFNLAGVTSFPTNHIDTIFCRNLLIYYATEAQNLIIKKFNTVLKPNSFLVLGMEETLWGNKFQNSFFLLHPRYRIYQKKLLLENNSDSISNQNAVISNYTTSIESLSNSNEG